MLKSNSGHGGRLAILAIGLALLLGIALSSGIALARMHETDQGGGAGVEQSVERGAASQGIPARRQALSPQAEIEMPSVDMGRVAPANPAVVLYDQYNVFGYSAITSQNFEPGFNAFDAQAADDFVVPVGSVWSIDLVEVAGAYAGGPADSVNVFFYADAGTLPGTPVYSETNIIPIAGGDTGAFVLPLFPPAHLAPGTYWVSVQANQAHASNGQWFWRNRASQANNGSAWRNPGGGFGRSSCTSNWGNRIYVCSLSDDSPDQVFRLSGSVLGTPTATTTGTPPTPTRTFTPALPSATRTATNTRTPGSPTRTGTRHVPSPVSTIPAPAGTPSTSPVTTSTPVPSCGLHARIVPSENVGFFSNSLSDVDMLSPNDGWAVGTFNSGQSSETLVLRWDGGSWHHVPSPGPGAHAVLLSVKVVSANDVWAVGFQANFGPTQTLILHWDGTQWSQVSSPNPGDSDNYLNEVTAVSSEDAWAVGHYRSGGSPYQHAMLLHWNGTEWSQASLPEMGLSNQLYSVAAVSEDDAWAAGSYYGTSGGGTVMLHWDGSQWSIVPTPNISTDVLVALAAISSQDVWVAGYRYTGNRQETLTMHWDGSEWSIVPSPSVQGRNNYLVDIDGHAPNDVWAVGYAGEYNYNQTLVERWDGSQWTIVPSANLGPYVNTLSGVSAVDYQNVMAVGYYSTGNTGRTLVERFSDPCATPTPTRSPTNTPTSTPTNTPTNTPTFTPTSTPTNTPTYTPTHTATYTPTNTATATPTPCPIQFTDVGWDNAFYPFIRCLACLGIVSGYNDGTFKPNNLVTRSQLAKIVSNAAGFGEAPGPQIFEDVPTSNPFYEWINRLTNRGYMSGYTCGGLGEPCVNGDRPYFRPFANATRAQTSKIVSNAARYSEPPAGQTFEDVPLTHPFYEWIQRLASREIMGGYECGGPGEPCMPGNRPYFRPYNNVTRGQSAKIVSNTFYPGCDMP